MRGFLLQIALLFTCTSALLGQTELRIGIFDRLRPQTIVVTNTAHNVYGVYGNGGLVYELPAGARVAMAYKQDGVVELGANGNTIGRYKRIELVGKSIHESFKIEVRSPARKAREYFGNLEVHASRGGLVMINNVHMEHYIGGVVESESGAHNKPEFYKAQAIIARTYALSNQDRHKLSGFNMCDQVHCQAYYNRAHTNPDIHLAAWETEGIVLVDADIELITASYHSNCGGQTVNSEDVWTGALPYLRSVTDTFCRAMPNAYWEKTIATNNWLSYLSKTYSFPAKEDSSHYMCAVDYCPHDREVYFADQRYKVPNEQLRKDWRLKSTYFEVQEGNGEVLLCGKGFGHGVGLCQEGGIHMAEIGYSYADILHFYYTQVHLVHLSVLDFFRAD